MKRIAVFCDGTWNGVEQPWPTNVRRMSVMVAPKAGDGAAQLSLYFQGVGVPEDGGWLERLNEKLSGGAMGFGLDDKIATAFLHLARAYEPGDEVFVFGFSRGAYTARSLVGLIRNCGLPRDPSPDLVRDCFAHYRDRSPDTKPDSPASLAFRRRVSPRITTSDAEAAWRAANGHAVGHPFRVAYLGVWDTVGALGIPSHWGLPARLLNRKYRFHDTDLSSMVLSARHAVALDEERRAYVPTLWSNLPKLRGEHPAGDYRQEWFAGVHGSVGGGGDIVSLSGLALLWIAAGATAAGLTFAKDDLAKIGGGCDPLGSLYNHSAERSALEKLMRLTGKSREGPDAIDMVAHPAIWRWHKADYRPRALRAVGSPLESFDLATIEDYAAVRIV